MVGARVLSCAGGTLGAMTGLEHDPQQPHQEPPRPSVPPSYPSDPAGGQPWAYQNVAPFGPPAIPPPYPPPPGPDAARSPRRRSRFGIALVVAGTIAASAAAG